MTTDIVFDSDGDIDLSTGSPRLFTADEAIDAVAQRVTFRLRTFLTEWFLDENKGFPWFQQVVGQKPTVEVVKALLRDYVLQVPEVTAVDEIEGDYDEERTFVVSSLKIKTSAGALSLTDIELL